MRGTQLSWRGLAVLVAMAWGVPAGGQVIHTHPIALEMHATDEEPTRHILGFTGSSLKSPQHVPRPVRGVLFPLPSDEPGTQLLRFSVVNRGSLTGPTYQAIDLERGAAFVDLGEIDDEEQAQAVELTFANLLKHGPVRKSVEFAIAEDRGQYSEDGYRFEALVRREGLRRPVQDAGNGQGQDPQPEAGPDAATGFTFRFWPLIFSHSVMAGAEGTQVLFVALPVDNNDEVGYGKIYIVLACGNSTNVDYPIENENPEDVWHEANVNHHPGTVQYLLVKAAPWNNAQTGPRHTTSVSGPHELPVNPTDEELRLVRTALEQGRADWQAVYGDSDCEP